MIKLDDLIARHRQIMEECHAELIRATDIEDEKTAKATCKTWEEERRIARDTLAWLEVAKRRGYQK